MREEVHSGRSYAFSIFYIPETKLVVGVQGEQQLFGGVEDMWVLGRDCGQVQHWFLRGQDIGKQE